MLELLYVILKWVMVMNDEAFRLSLIDITDSDLLNDFVNDIFGYDFILDNGEYVYIQYKIVLGNIVLNIYDNKLCNRFKAYIFTLSDFGSDEYANYINVKKEYDKYISGNRDKICLLCSLLISDVYDEKKEIIDCLFNGKIRDIFSRYFL